MSTELDNNATVADQQLQYCRRCAIPGCDECEDGPDERCKVCGAGHKRTANGTCEIAFARLTRYALIVGGAIVLFLLAWYIELVTRPVVNREGLEEGLNWRSRTKPRRMEVVTSSSSSTSSEPTSRPAPTPTSNVRWALWPLNTNLRTNPNVGGPGLALHFNFQVAVMVWATVILLAWLVVVKTTGHNDLLTVGTREASSPQQLCAVVAWGHRVQSEVMNVKANFVLFVYITSTALALLHAVLQKRRFMAMDDETTMRDFAALCTNLPVESGSERVEEKVKKIMEERTSQQVIGVSVCWDFRDKEHAVTKALTQQANFQNDSQSLRSVTFRDSGSRLRIFRAVDALLGFSVDAPKENDEDDMERLLHCLKSSGCAFVVFNSEASRDAAVRAMENAGREAEDDQGIQLRKLWVEPDTVQWENFQNENEGGEWWRLALGVLYILGTVAVWTLVFYLPYAYYIASSSYARGTEPGFIPVTLFSLVIVGGNQMMYFICDQVSFFMHYRYSGNREAIYTILYTFACLLQVVLDLIVTGYTSYKTMLAYGARTYDGKMLEELGAFGAIFESYPMQKALGKALFEYAFPSCFLLPFIMEPIFSIMLPRHLCALLVRSHAWVRGREAELSMAFFCPMNLGRYADLLLNLILAVLVMFFPGGFFFKMFACLIISHIYIYLYDKYRVLRMVPEFSYSDEVVDKCGNLLLILPCGLLAACWVFKRNAQWGHTSADSPRLFAFVAAAFLAHVILHLMLLHCLSERFANPDHEPSAKSWDEFSQMAPRSWFNMNPVHCLRSKFIYKHNPPCSYYVQGKENLLQRNPAANAYFTGKDLDVEEEEELAQVLSKKWTPRPA